MYKVLGELHEELNKDISLDEFKASFYVKYPDANKETYDLLFVSLAEADISADAGENLLKQIQQRKLLLQLSEKAYAATQGRASLEELQQLATSLDSGPSSSGIEDSFVTDDLEILVTETVQRSGLRWRLDFLNKSLGSLRQGDLGLIFARPETGKTTFLASEISHMLTQTEQPILWFNNEEQGGKVMIRVYQAFFGVKLHQILENVKEYKAEFKRLVGGRLLMVDNALTDKRTVETLVEKTKPGLILYDQLPKIKGFKADREDQVLGAICIWARELAKAYAPSIGVLQAGGIAEGQKWLTMDHVAKVKTEVQAEADFMLGIGKTHDRDTEFIRYLNISKNKLFGDEDSIPALKHGHTEVLIQPEIARYKDIVKYE